MPFVYILVSEKTGSFYIGSTNNIERRLAEHNSGQTASLVNKIPLSVAFYQEYATIVEAKRMERKLKKFKSRKVLEQIVRDRSINTGL